MLRDVLKLGMLLETAAYQQGRAAHGTGAAMADNPYRERNFRTDWELGWRDARRAQAANENRQMAGGDPFADGKAAAAAGRDTLANPYHPGHPGFDAWRLGWATRKAS